MLDKIQKAVDTRLPSVAVAAFQTAIHQQEAIEEATQELRAREREARAERQRNARDEAVQLSDAIDVAQKSAVDSGEDSGGRPERGRAVDVKV